MNEWLVPEPIQTFDLTMQDGAIIRVRRHGNPDGPRLALSHGNGFAIDGYLPFWTLLTDDFDLVLFDQRNHGNNPRHDVAHHDLANFTSDMVEIRNGIDAALGAKPTAGIFHSISAIAAIWDAVQNGARWDALVFFDPPLFPGPDDALYPFSNDYEAKMAAWAESRPDRFADPSELGAAFKKSYRLHRWVDGAHELMARAVLRRDQTTGEWSLRCPREGEARIYRTPDEVDLCSRLDRLDCPAIFICADPDQSDALAPSIVNQEIHARFGYRYEVVADTNHLLQIEKPAECARIALAFLDECGFGSS